MRGSDILLWLSQVLQLLLCLWVQQHGCASLVLACPALQLNPTYYPTQADTSNVTKRWFIIDAEGKTLGRLATLAALYIRWGSCCIGRTADMYIFSMQAQRGCQQVWQAAACRWPVMPASMSILSMLERASSLLPALCQAAANETQANKHQSQAQWHECQASHHNKALPPNSRQSAVYDACFQAS